MNEKMRECVVCNAKFKYCARCGRSNIKEPWRLVYHDETCKQIFNICSNYVGGTLNANEAKSMLDNLTLPTGLKDHIKNNINKIMSEASEENKKIEESAVENINLENENSDEEKVESSNEESDVQVYETKALRKRKRKF